MMSEEVNCMKEIQERLKDLGGDTPKGQVRYVLEELIPLLARLDEVEFERLWADLRRASEFEGAVFLRITAKNQRYQ